MSLMDDARLNGFSFEESPPDELREMRAKLMVLQAMVERHDRLIDQQGEVLERLTNFMSEHHPTLREIMDAVAEYYSVTRDEIESHKHIQYFSHPRLVVYYLARKLTRLSLTNIADRIGGRDHTTIRTGFFKISHQIRHNEVLRDDIDVLRARIAEKVMERELATTKGGTLLPAPVRQ
jgi:chromosomal replication initiation ATPase DnaA